MNNGTMPNILVAGRISVEYFIGAGLATGFIILKDDILLKTKFR